MTEEIDIKKLTDDAFMAIDAIFTDEDDNLFSEAKESEPDDFDLIQEYMLAIEWECSDKNIKKFIDFLNKITPKYTGKHNQDILKMLTSIVRYLEKSKDKAVPETHHVMEFIVTTFRHINQKDTDEATIKQDKTNAYSKVLELKNKIAKHKVENSKLAQEHIHTTKMAKDDVAATQTSDNLSANLQPEIPFTPIAQQLEPIENSKIILSILARLEFCEKRLSILDTQNIELQQKVDELTNLNSQITQQFASELNELDLKFSDQINDLSHVLYSIPTTLEPLPKEEEDDKLDKLSMSDKAALTELGDGELSQYDDINFDGIDFDYMTSDINIDKEGKPSESSNNVNEVSLDEIEIEEISLGEIDGDIYKEPKQVIELSEQELDFDNLNVEALDSIELSISSDEVHTTNSNSPILDRLNNNDNQIVVEELNSEDIEYEELSSSDIQYENDINVSSNIVGEKSIPEIDIEDIFKEQDSNKIVSDNSYKNINLEEIGIAGYRGEDTPKYVRCFKLEDQTIALPDDKIFNVYKIPSKLTANINQMPNLMLGDLSSLFQNLSKNMKGHLKGVNVAIIKKMNVDVHLITSQNVQYKIAILCSFENKISIIPVTDIYDDRTHLMVDIKDGRNSFSNYSVNIVDMGLIPFIPLSKR